MVTFFFEYPSGQTQVALMTNLTRNGKPSGNCNFINLVAYTGNDAQPCVPVQMSFIPNWKLALSTREELMGA